MPSTGILYPIVCTHSPFHDLQDYKL
jgi:hypothetical protein